MIHLKIILLIIALVMATGTMKAQEAVPGSNVEKLRTTTDLDEAIATYQIMTAEERYSYWMERLTADIDSGKLNAVETDLVKEVMKELKVSYFSDKQSAEKDQFINKYLPEFLGKVVIQFRQLPLENTFILGGEVGVKCDCNTGSLFNPCYKENCRDGAKRCEFQYFGCGAFAIFPCNGKCSYR